VRTVVANQQAAARVDPARLRRLVAFLAARAAARAATEGWTGVSVVLTDDDGIRMFHRQYLRSDRVTDVVSVGFDPLPDERAPSADVFVNVQRAIEEGARRPRWSADRELALYLAHAFNHLSGGQDHTAPGRRAMRRLDLRWVREAATAGLLAGLVRKDGRRKG
jgi:rRNA maturation RNase YbeY